METDNVYTDKNELWIFKHLLLFFVVSAFLFQIVVYTNTTNVTCSVLILVSTLITFNVTLNPSRFYRFPLWVFGMFFYNLTTSSGALIMKSLEGDMVIDKLQVPLESFSMFFVVTVVINIIIYVKSERNENRKITVIQKNLRNWGLIEWPSDKVLWSLGFIGLVSTIIAQTGFVGEENRTLLDKVLMGIVFTRYLPILTLFKEFNGQPKSKKNVGPVIAYFGLLIIVGILKNSRGTFMDGIILTGLLMFISLGMGFFHLSRVKFSHYL